jgi:hypothetical protein
VRGWVRERMGKRLVKGGSYPSPPSTSLAVSEDKQKPSLVKCLSWVYAVCTKNTPSENFSVPNLNQTKPFCERGRKDVFRLKERTPIQQSSLFVARFHNNSNKVRECSLDATLWIHTESCSQSPHIHLDNFIFSFHLIRTNEQTNKDWLRLQQVPWKQHFSC